MEREELLDYYFEQIDKTTPLSREEEVKLSRKVKKGDIKARNKLVEANLRFVVRIAKEYQKRGLDLDELISCGNHGLIKAAARFEGEMGNKFISYAVWWIRQSILEYIGNSTRVVRIPLNILNASHKIERERLKIENSGKISTVSAIAENLKKNRKSVEDNILLRQPSKSLNDPVFFDSNYDIIESVIYDTQENPDDILDKIEKQKTIKKFLSILDERERKIIILYYGIDDDNPLTLEKIGKILGLTRERVRQLKELALNKIRARLAKEEKNFNFF